MKQFILDLGNVCLAPKGKWSREQEYERLALVYNAYNNLSYVAKINVPSGVDIENREYWQPMNATGYADNNFINLTTENENGTITAYESIEEAIATIVPINRKVGATLSFYNLNSDRLDRQAEFELWQFNSTDLANWENKDYWNNIYYNWNVFAGWYIDADALKNHVKTPNVGQYAYVGSNLNDAILYQCRTNGTWTNTGIKVRNYISVVIKGNITIGENGNWFSDGEDTGIPSTPAVDEQLDNIIMQLQQHTTEINNIKKYNTNLQNQITSNDSDITNLTTKHESLSRTVQGIAATSGASTATNVTYNNNTSGLNAENAQDAIDELKDTIGTSFKVEAQYTNKYISVGNAKVGDVIDTETLIHNAAYDCAIYPSSEGDIIHITGTGGFAPRLWTFLDEEKRLISKSKFTEYNTTLIAPPNTAFVIFSWEKGASVAYVFDATITPINGLVGLVQNHTVNIANINAELGNITFSNDKRLNRIIKELYLYDTSSIKDKTAIIIRCGLKSDSTDKYFNSIRLGVDDRTSPNFGYVDLYFEYSETQEDALAAMRRSSVISTPTGVAIINTSSIELGELYNDNAICKDYSQLYNSPSIATFLSESEKKEVEDKKMVLAQANTLAINGNNVYQCPDQFKAGSLVKVYRQGLLVNPSEYTLFKQGKVQFKDTTDVPPSDILFEYEKNTKHINSRSLLLDSTSQLAYQTEDASTQLYSFVNDPTSGDQKVMMLHCSQITSSKVRMQFQLANLHATYFHDRVKMFLPTDMKNALLSYNGAINWFSIGGSWGIFGSSTGQLSNMYSGSANSFDIFKDAGGNRLYFHQINRRRDVNTETGLEEYTVLSEGSSTFDVLDNEWITIEREFQAGNPGFCKYKITDSKGVHTMEVNPAYNVVCDVENEKQKYGDKLINDIPYNEFPSPFVAKIYTSNAVIQHCIDTIGKAYLYFKEYELIKATAVNIY